MSASNGHGPVADLERLIAHLEEENRGLQDECNDLSRDLDEAESELKTARSLLRETRWEKRNGTGLFVARPADPSQMVPMEWVWEPFVARGALNLATGREEAGKSTFEVWIAARITRGELPGAFDGTPRDVLFIGADEDDWNSIVMPRLHAAGADFDHVFEFYAGDDQTVFDLRAIDALDRVLADRKFGLIVIEQLMDLLPPMRSYTDPAAMRAALRPLSRCLRRRDVAGLGTLHTNKAPGGSLREVQQGTVQFGAVSRSSFIVARHPKDPTRRVAIVGKGNYVGPKHKTSMEFVIVESVFTMNGEVFSMGKVEDVEASDVTLEEALGGQPGASPQTAVRDERTEAVLAVLGDEAQSEAAIVTAASEWLGLDEKIPRTSVQRILRRLQAAETAVQTPDGWKGCPPAHSLGNGRAGTPTEPMFTDPPMNAIHDYEETR